MGQWEGGDGGGEVTGGANGKGGKNVRKCVICEVLLDLFLHSMCCNYKEKINTPVL